MRSVLAAWSRSPHAVALSAALLVAAASLAAWQLGLYQTLEFRVYDEFSRHRPAYSGRPVPVVLISITEHDIARYGHPIPDAILAQGLANVMQSGPRAVGVDLYRDQATGGGWQQLAEMVTGDPRIVMVEKLADDIHPGVSAPAFLGERSQVGFSDVVVDSDGVVRRGLLYLWGQDDLPFVSFGLQLAVRYLRSEGIALGPDPDHPEYVRLGRTTLVPFRANDAAYVRADDGGYQFLLDYRRGPSPFPQIAFGEVFEGAFAPEQLRDRVVILGTASPSVKDYFHTPLTVGDDNASMIHGTEVHAHAVDQLLRIALEGHQPLRTIPTGAQIVWLVLWSLLGAIVGTFGRSALVLVGLLIGTLGFLAALAFASFLADWWLPALPPALATLASSLLTTAYLSRRERHEKALLMDLFGRHVSARVADRLWEQRDDFMEGGRPRPQRLTASVLITDLSGYTSTSERLEPSVLAEWTNSYLEMTARLVEQHGGMVDDYFGDGLKADFGVPLPRTSEAEIEEDARNAVQCALAMERKIRELNERWMERGIPAARLRVGIVTGTVVAASLGSAARLKYSTVGDTVNTASRLVAFDKEGFDSGFGHPECRILIGETTWCRLGGGFQGHSLGVHQLRGKEEPVEIYRVLAQRDAGDESGSREVRAS